MEEELLEYDNLSFSNFSISQEDNNENSVMKQSPRNSFSSVENEEEFFEFPTTTPIVYSSPDLVFCRTIVHEEDHHRNEYRKRDYLMNINLTEEKVVLAEKDKFRSSSTDGRSVSSMTTTKTIKRNSSYNNNYGIQKVNITSLTSMSSKSRRRMFMFGPVKFHPEMELSALKERQSRRGRVPTTMFPPPQPAVDVEKAVMVSETADGGENKRKRGKIRSNWGLLVRSLKGRSPISTVLAKSLGCMMTPVGVGMEKWIRVAN